MGLFKKLKSLFITKEKTTMDENIVNVNEEIGVEDNTASFDPRLLEKLPCNSCSIKPVCKHAVDVTKFYVDMMTNTEYREVLDIISVNLTCKFQGLSKPVQTYDPMNTQTYNMTQPSAPSINTDRTQYNPVYDNIHYHTKSYDVSHNTQTDSIYDTQNSIGLNDGITSGGNTLVNVSNTEQYGPNTLTPFTENDEPIDITGKQRAKAQENFVKEIMGAIHKEDKDLCTSTIDGREIKGINAQTEQGTYVSINTKARIR